MLLIGRVVGSWSGNDDLRRSRPSGPPDAPLLARLASPKAAKLLVRDAIVNSGTFALGLGLMWVFVELANIDEIVAAAASFLVANSLHYGFARSWIFRGTRRA